jgi:hypothetical protein
VRQHKKEDASVDDNNDDDKVDNNDHGNKIACTNDDAARWSSLTLAILIGKSLSSRPRHQACLLTKGKWMQSMQQPCGAMLVLGRQRNAS